MGSSRHEFEVRGDHVAFFIVRRNGERHTVLIDADDAERVLAIRWCLMPHKRSGFYVVSRIPKSTNRFISLHRFVMNAPANLMVDHEHHDTMDNRKSELRVADRSTNGFNRKGLTAHNTSGYRGVYLHRASRLWHACVRIHRVNKSLGYYSDPAQAGGKVHDFLIAHALIPAERMAQYGK